MKDKYTFNLERAKAGDPIEYLNVTNNWIRVHFVGQCSSGPVAVETDTDYFWAHLQYLRMAPKKRTVYVNLLKVLHTSPCDGQAAYFSSEEEAIRIASFYPQNYICVAAPLEIEA